MTDSTAGYLRTEANVKVFGQSWCVYCVYTFSSLNAIWKVEGNDALSWLSSKHSESSGFLYCATTFCASTRWEKRHSCVVLFMPEAGFCLLILQRWVIKRQCFFIVFQFKKSRWKSKLFNEIRWICGSWKSGRYKHGNSKTNCFKLAAAGLVSAAPYFVNEQQSNSRNWFWFYGTESKTALKQKSWFTPEWTELALGSKTSAVLMQWPFYFDLRARLKTVKTDDLFLWWNVLN